MKIAQIIFLVAFLIAAFFFFKRVLFIRRNILLGKKESLNDNKGKRWKNMILFALGQKKMFRRPIPALLHLVVYLGFIIINIELIEIAIDGIAGTHRIFASFLGGFYDVLISSFEVFGALVLIACLLFLVRRNVLKIKRFHSKEMTSWPKSDANIILIVEIVLMTAFLVMDTTDQAYVAATGGETHNFLIANMLMPLFDGFSTSTLHLIERIGWWVHIIGIMGFAVYVTYSKHLHIFLAFPNTWYSRNFSSGKIRNMPEITNEVKLMLDPSAADAGGDMPPPERFGAKDVLDLSWKSLMDSYACTECGRCTDVCPANQTGKKLSPRKVMMDTRDRLEEVGRLKDAKQEEKIAEKSLLHDYITTEELNACTTCQACVQECPVNINPLNIIQELRRCLIMEESNAPAEWNLMFSNLENNMAPWQFSPDDRSKWINE